MKTRLCLVWIALLTLASARTWTDSQGRTVEAQFISASESKVTLRRESDNKTFTLDLSKLSQNDRDFVAAQLAQQKRQAEIDASRVRVRGKVVGICTTGILVECEPEQSFTPPADRLSRIGGGGKQTSPQPTLDSSPMRVIGTFFIRDYPGKEKLTDYEAIDVEAYPAGQVTSYTFLDGTKVLETWPAYALQPAQ